MAGLKEKFYTLILKFVNITFCYTNGTTDYVAADDFDGIGLIYCKVSSELVHSVHSLLICVSSFN